MTEKKGSLVVISGPSGVGKGTICKALLADRDNWDCSISATTRQPRTGEQDGVDYHFMTEADFCAGIENDEFLEWAKVYDNYYGTLKQVVDEKLSRGRHVILEIDTEGAKQIKAKMPSAVLIYIMPPSVEELESRLRGRATDSPEVIEKRLSCFETELAQRKYYDHIVVNTTVPAATAAIEQIIRM